MRGPRFQFRLRTLFRLTFWIALACLVGQPGWTWVKATYFPQETGGPGAIQSYQNNITCSFCYDPVKVWRLKHRLHRLGSRRIQRTIALSREPHSRRRLQTRGALRPRAPLPPEVSRLQQIAQSAVVAPRGSQINFE